MRKIILALLILVPMAALGQVSNPDIIPATVEPASCPVIPWYYIASTNTVYGGNGSGTCQQINGGGGGGSGTVTSVTFTGDGVVDSSTPSTAVTVAGTVAATIKNQSANTVLAGPTSGGAAAPSFQTAPTISAANMTNFPTLNQNTSGTASNLSGTPALPNGTTATTQTAADNSTKLATTAYVDAKSTGALTQIAQTVVAGTSTSAVTFSAIPGTYSSLRVVMTARGSDAANNTNIDVTFNGDTAAHYDIAYVNNATAQQFQAQSSMSFITVDAANAAANQASQAEVLIPSYAGTTFFKTCSVSNAGFANTTSAGVYVYSSAIGQWRSTAAITSITLTDDSGGHFIAGSTFTLYGMQ